MNRLALILALAFLSVSCSTQNAPKTYPTVPSPTQNVSKTHSLAAIIRKPLNLTIAWVPSSSSNAAGYNLYYGAFSRAYTNLMDVGNVSSITVSNLIRGKTYYFSATTYTTAGLESDFSNEVLWPAPTPPTTCVVTVSGINLEYSSSLAGPWAKTGVNNLTFTNPAGVMFFRGTNAMISLKRF